MSPSLFTGEGSEGRGGIEGGKDSSALPLDALLSSLVWVDGEKGRDASYATAAGRLIATDAGGFVALFVGRAGGFVLFVGGGGSGVALFDGGGGGFVVAAG